MCGHSEQTNSIQSALNESKFNLPLFPLKRFAHGKVPVGNNRGAQREVCKERRGRSLSEAVKSTVDWLESQDIWHNEKLPKFKLDLGPFYILARSISFFSASG